MKTIWKYQVITEMDIMLPVGARVLAIQEQYDVPKMWVLVDPEAAMEMRHFRAYGTGHKMPDNPGVHIGTFQLAKGNLVFHVFESPQ